MGQHVFETRMIARAERTGLGNRRAVVIVELHVEALGAPRDRLSDPAHAENAEPPCRSHHGRADVVGDQAPQLASRTMRSPQ